MRRSRNLNVLLTWVCRKSAGTQTQKCVIILWTTKVIPHLCGQHDLSGPDQSRWQTIAKRAQALQCHQCQMVSESGR